jgi:hypothetical protein
MIEKCSITNINNNMQFIGLIILILIICIVFLYYIKISNEKHNEIIEKYNTGTAPLSTLIKAPYLNTNGGSPQNQQISDMHKNARYPTSNKEKISTATLRPCQIHFNEDGTSKYIYEDEWKEFDTLISDEDNSVYKVPYKKFGNDNNNEKEFVNFNETTKCFKKKQEFNNVLNTYKYISNDLIKYKLDTYIEINVEDNKNYEKHLFMQMNFDKQPNNSPVNKYKENVLNSICSYNYNKDLKLGNIKLYRLTIVPQRDSSVNINNTLITAIDYVTIKPVDNSIMLTSSESETKNVLPELLVSNSSYFTIDNNNNIRYEIRKNQVTGDAVNGINVKIYKFNFNLDCDNNAIKSYETKDMRFKSEELISVTNYVSDIINKVNPYPSDISISNVIDIINKDELSGKVINGMSKELLTNSLNFTIKMEYDSKDEFLQDIYYFICKLIIYSNQQLVIDIITLINNNAINANKKKSFIDSFDTLSKFIPLYQTNIFDDIKKKQLFLNIAQGKSILNNGIFLYKYESVPQIIFNEDVPFELENIDDIFIYDINTVNKTFVVKENTICDILIVGGGGGGGSDGGGGGGGGQVLYYTNLNVPFKTGNSIMLNGTYTIEIGNGGIGASKHNSNGRGGKGGNTRIFNSISELKAIGGGGGGGSQGRGEGGNVGGAGGYGHFVAGDIATSSNGGGSGGTPGGPKGWVYGGSGGGGGANVTNKNGGNGSKVPNLNQGAGGEGVNINISGISEGYGGGGGGGGCGQQKGGFATHGGGSGHGGVGKNNTGGGGGSSQHGSGSDGGRGGSGIIIIRLSKIPAKITNTNANKRELVINSGTSSIFRDGLYFKIFNKYYNDNFNHTKNNGIPRQHDKGEGIVSRIDNISVGTNNTIPSNNSWKEYTVEWQGFFYAKVTGNYQFFISSDDASHLWIGEGALDSDINKLVINNGGEHPMRAVRGTIYLTAGIYYPMRILFGENQGEDQMHFYFAPPGSTWQANGFGWFYHIPENKNLDKNILTFLKPKDNLLKKIITKNKDIVVTVNDTTNLKLLKLEKYFITHIFNKTNIYQGGINIIREFLHSGGIENQTIHSINFERDSICDILIIGGGGGGGRNITKLTAPKGRDKNKGTGDAGGGGGGAGGLIYLKNYKVNKGTYKIAVGAGGNVDVNNNNMGAGFNGFNSSFGIQVNSDIVAIGGGGGGSAFRNIKGRNGGSGGGAGSGGGEQSWIISDWSEENKKGQGYQGGSNKSSSNWGGAGAGGGGAEGLGEYWENVNGKIIAGRGGKGKSIDIKGSLFTYSKGGDGGQWDGNNVPINGAINTGNGGDGSGFKQAGRGGSGIVIIKLLADSIYESDGDSIKLTYEIEDNRGSNLKNAQDNKKLIINTQNYIEPIDQVINPNVYKIGTKIESEPYMKFSIIIHSLNIGTITFQKGPDAGIIPVSDYEITIVRDNNNVKITKIIVLFYNNVKGDIYMKLSGYSNVFIYNTNNDPNKQDQTKIDISQDFRDYLAIQIPSKDSIINSIFDLDTYNTNVQKIINNRTSVTINTDGSLKINGIKNDITKNKLENLEIIYNNIKKFDSQSTEKKPTLTINSNKKIIDIIPTFNTNIVSYENPKEKHPKLYSSTYNIQDVSNNYIYFRYPNQ